MTACTDDERREVAERLRELELGTIGTLIPTGELAENILRAISYGRSGAMTPYGCLADLIDPDTTTDTTKSAAVSPERDDTRERLARALGIDLPALLSLEDEMFEDATGLAFISQLEKNEELQDLQSTMAKALMDYARRIREALVAVA